MPGNTLDVYRAVKKSVEKVLIPRGLTVKSAGFKQDRLNEALSQTSGFWEEPNRVTSKPPRWIIQFEKKNGFVVANFAKKHDDTYYPASKTIGYINNREGNCSAMIFRIIASIKDSERYIFPDWEWVMLLVFNKSLPAGNSSETITSFDPLEKSIVYQRRSYKYSLLGIIKTNVENETIPLEEDESISYAEASNALKELLENGTEVEG
ncbi:hypothetical protein [Cohnella laeviribosi]|uniref:hypothetical protein n=1 Tax=Cohnella laeviribosi TaxID=380174 RepID=UPI003D242DCC